MILKHPKFRRESLKSIEKLLKEDLDSNYNKDSYYFCYSEEVPLFLVLIYLNRYGKIKQEFVKVNPSDGLFFHQRYFDSLDDVINYFKTYLNEFHLL